MKKKKENEHRLAIYKAEALNKIGPKLDKIYELNKKNTKKINDNLIKLIADTENLYNAYENLKTNKGLLTKGTDEQDNPEKLTKEYIKNLSNEIIQGTFQWKPIRKIEIPKPGTKKKRPLGIPNFTDKLVQEGIRIVLNCIYEPSDRKSVV